MARRKTTPRGVLPTNADVEAALEFSARESVQEEAEQYAPQALKALKDICEGSESDSARVSAARAILEYAAGKPALQAPMAPQHGRGLIVNVLNLTTGDKMERYLSPTLGAEIQEAVKRATEIGGGDAQH